MTARYKHVVVSKKRGASTIQLFVRNRIEWAAYRLKPMNDAKVCGKPPYSLRLEPCPMLGLAVQYRPPHATRYDPGAIIVQLIARSSKLWMILEYQVEWINYRCMTHKDLFAVRLERQPIVGVS